MARKDSIRHCFSDPNREKPESLLSPAQVRDMARGRGCIQCGKPATAIQHGWRVCDSKICRRQVGVIWLSYQVAARFRGVAVESLLSWRRENLARFFQ